MFSQDNAVPSQEALHRCEWSGRSRTQDDFDSGRPAKASPCQSTTQSRACGLHGSRSSHRAVILSDMIFGRVCRYSELDFSIPVIVSFFTLPRSSRGQINVHSSLRTPQTGQIEVMGGSRDNSRPYDYGGQSGVASGISFLERLTQRSCHKPTCRLPSRIFEDRITLPPKDKESFHAGFFIFFPLAVQ